MTREGTPSVLVACRECDGLHRRADLPKGGAACCCRCGSVLYRTPRLKGDHVLALILAALITLTIAHCFPIVALQVNGIPSSTTLFGCVLSLWREGSMVTAALVFATALLFPLLDLFSVLALLTVTWLTPRSVWRGRLSRFVTALRPWGMTEVFVLGVVVSLVKLSHLARVVPGVALWAFAATAVLLAVVASFDLRTLWEDGE
ncbi:MAG TPA: paraquat-inducible protein A [Candidatus Sulfotelmatobacter sp.]|nr:paraquat-inducible protein A [Candidatus Sulfotelmatobacter sp.]